MGAKRRLSLSCLALNYRKGSMGFSPPYPPHSTSSSSHTDWWQHKQIRASFSIETRRAVSMHRMASLVWTPQTLYRAIYWVNHGVTFFFPLTLFYMWQTPPFHPNLILYLLFSFQRHKETADNKTWGEGQGKRRGLDFYEYRCFKR